MRIILGTFVAATVCGMAFQSHAAVDSIYLNGKIFTADTAQPHVTAFALEGDKILKVGNDEEIRALADGKTSIIDLAGKRVMPGLVDSHSHAIFGGIQLATADMTDEEVDLKELEKRLIAWRDDGKARHGDVLMVTGMHSRYWSKADGFDKIFNHGEWAEVPIVFFGSDYHTAWVNNMMLARAKIDRNYVATLPEDQKHTIGVKKKRRAQRGSGRCRVGPRQQDDAQAVRSRFA